MTRTDPVTEGRVVIVGAGQAGVTTAMHLRDQGWQGGVTLLGDEPGTPYQRPPLSKDCLLGGESVDGFPLQTLASLEREGIDYRPGRRVRRIDPEVGRVELGDGDRVGYERLVLATGSRARRLGLPGEDLDGVMRLRSSADAAGLQAGLSAARQVVIIGGGFLGLEIASAADRRADAVTVLALPPRPMRGAVSAPIADALAAAHRRRGVGIRTDAVATAIEGSGGRVVAVRLGDGSAIPADLVVVAVGAVPATELAEAARLAVDAGVVVDGRLRTSDPRIYAIGDCARHPSAFAGRPVRIESVQNATDQGRFAAADLLGLTTSDYRALPWFWSHQAGRNLQIAGVAHPGDSAIVVDGDEDRLVVHRIRDGALVAVETLDHPRAHIRARRVLADGPVPIGGADLQAVLG